LRILGSGYFVNLMMSMDYCTGNWSSWMWN